MGNAGYTHVYKYCHDGLCSSNRVRTAQCLFCRDIYRLISLYPMSLMIPKRAYITLFGMSCHVTSRHITQCHFTQANVTYVSSHLNSPSQFKYLTKTLPRVSMVFGRHLTDWQIDRNNVFRSNYCLLQKESSVCSVAQAYPLYTYPATSSLTFTSDSPVPNLCATFLRPISTSILLQAYIHIYPSIITSPTSRPPACFTHICDFRNI